jgi:hypothetical protein
MSPNARGGTQLYYTCNRGKHHPRGHEKHHTKSVSMAHADSYAVAQTFHLLKTPGEAEAAIQRLAEQRDAADDELTVTRANLARIDATLEAQQRVFAALHPAHAATFIMTHQKLQEERAQEAERVAKLSAAHTRVTSLTTALAAAVQAARSRAQGYELPAEMEVFISRDELLTFVDFLDVPTAEQRKVMRALGVHVVVSAKQGNPGRRGQVAGGRGWPSCYL